MLDLSPQTEMLARRLASETSLTVDQIVRRALELTAGLSGTSQAEGSGGRTALRRAALARAVEVVASLPDLDHRTSADIADELDPL